LRSPQKQHALGATAAAAAGEKETPIKIAQEPARIRFMGTCVIAARCRSMWCDVWFVDMPECDVR
jgi:hypothetical protein